MQIQTIKNLDMWNRGRNCNVENRKIKECPVQQHIADLIWRNGSINLNKITQKSRRFTHAQRMDAIESLLQACDIICHKEGKKLTFTLS